MAAAGSLFAYGTLLIGEIFSAVTGLTRQGVRARLQGYRRYRVAKQRYPAITADATGEVSGLLYPNIRPAVWARLDAFESSLYQRITTHVRLADGSSHEAQTYVIAPAHTSLLSDQDWDENHFRAQGYTEYLFAGPPA